MASEKANLNSSATDAVTADVVISGGIRGYEVDAHFPYEPYIVIDAAAPRYAPLDERFCMLLRAHLVNESSMQRLYCVVRHA